MSAKGVHGQGRPMKRMSVDAVGRLLLARATHYNHGEGWQYTRNTGDLEHIRYRRDYTGRNSLLNRIHRAFEWRMLTGKDGLFGREQRLSLRFLHAWAWVVISIRKERNLPDGKVGPVIAFWEEDGEYIEMVGPTIGERIAEFLIAEPTNPHAIAIAAEIQRVAALPEPEADG